MTAGTPRDRRSPKSTRDPKSPRGGTRSASAAAPRTCPCGTGQPYEACCGRFHSGAAGAPTAEALMRSRYSAFAVRDEAYLLRTWHPRTRPVSVELGDGPRWTGLEILATEAGSAFHSTGVVTFRARFTDGGRAGELRERSRFERIEGAWVYVDGDVEP
ncbi:YchJ family protein [Streptomyces sp. TS71-3]|uniref:YchJ family protein n=1 Tax=Streptomyces sp. TS71-3 TaxID=2733862 RepID=UPI001BB34EB8|nr:YchJ family protein [Streptomyces sp. TS71-3]